MGTHPSFIHTWLSSCMGTGTSIIIQLHLQDFSKSHYSSIFFQIIKSLSQHIHISPNLHHPKHIINTEKLQIFSPFQFYNPPHYKTPPHFPRPWSSRRSTLSHFSLLSLASPIFIAQLPKIFCRASNFVKKAH